MGFINVAERTINAKLVYYGVGVGGKTTSLQQVHGIFCPRNEVQLVSINTEEESTLLFDFLPINLGTVSGFKIRVQGFTVPGQPKYERMRRYVLQGADAVVFVVDSQRSRLDENLESLHSMRAHLREQASAAEDVPIVVQYNKRDLEDALDEATLDRHFRFRDGVPAFPSVATEGRGVFEAFVEATAALVERKVEHYQLTDAGSPREVADGVRQKLWALGDDVRRGRATVPSAELPRVRLGPLAESAQGISRGPFELRDEAPAAAPTPGDEPAQDAIGFGYELRDEAAAPAGVPCVHHGDEVLSDDELDVDLDAASQASAPAPVEDGAAALLDQTVQSNLELVAQFGRVDEERQQLARKVGELVDAAQCAVHDLNRPISALRLMLATLDKGYLGALSAPQNQAVQNGLLAVDQLQRLVGDLLDSSRLDHDGVRLEFAACDLRELVEQVLETSRFELDEHGVVVELGELPTVEVDRWGLTKALSNLVGNAIAYRAHDRSPRLRVFAEDHGEQWVIAVEDNGIGVPAADQARLFQRFERGSNVTGRSGSGLGLHIVREVVQGHGGEVTLVSEVGRGTTFRLHLPKAPSLAPHSPISDVDVGGLG